MFGFPWKETDLFRKSKTRIKPQVESLETREVPALFAQADQYNVDLGRVLSVPVPGVLANDFSDTNPGEVIVATFPTTAKYVSPTGVPLPPLPANSVRGNPDGSFTFVAPSSIPQLARGANGVQVTFDYIATIPNTAETATGTVTINIAETQVRLIAVAPEAGAAPEVKVYETGNNNLRLTLTPYESTFTGGVRVAVGDINADGVDDIITVPATGGAVRVRAFDGVDGTPLADFFAFDPAFRGGGYVAVGNFDGAPISPGSGGSFGNEIVVGAGEGGGPRVQIYQIILNNTLVQPTVTTNVIADFFAYEDTARNGVRVAMGDVRNVGRDFVITAPGNGGGPRVRVFDGQKILSRPFASTTAPSTLDFFATEGSNRAGVFIAAGDLSGNGTDSIITGTGTGPGIVRVFEGQAAGLTREFRVPVEETPTGGGTLGGPGNFGLQTPINGQLLSPSLSPNTLVPSGFAGAVPTNPLVGAVFGGVRVAATDYNGDGLDDIVVGQGPGNTPRIRVFDTKNQAELTSILAFSPTFLGGVNVSAS